MAAYISLFIGPFLCTFVDFPALFRSQFDSLSMFMVTCGALTCFFKTQYQAADHQGGEAPRGQAVLTRVGLQIPTKHHNSLQPPRPSHLILVLLWRNTLSWSLLTERGCRTRWAGEDDMVGDRPTFPIRWSGKYWKDILKSLIIYPTYRKTAGEASAVHHSCRHIRKGYCFRSIPRRD